KVAVVAHRRAEIREELEAVQRGQDQIGLAVAVVIRPYGRASAKDAGQKRLAHGFAAILQQHDLVAPDEAEVLFAVAVKVDDGNRLGFGIDAADRRDMGKAGHALEPAEIFAAPADEIALRVVILNLQARFHPLDFGAAIVQILLVAVHHARDNNFL